MQVFRARHDNVPESPIRTLYGRKGNLLLLPLDVCVLYAVNGVEEFRPVVETNRLIAAPILEAGDGRLGLIAHYEWPPLQRSRSARSFRVNPVVTVQLAPSASIKGMDDLRVLASQCAAGDRVFLFDGVGGSEGRKEGVLIALLDWHPYPDIPHRTKAYQVAFESRLEPVLHGAAVRLATGELLGMLIATQNQPDGSCRALVYPA